MLQDLVRIITEIRELSAEVHGETIVLHAHLLLQQYNLTSLLKSNGGKLVLGKVWACRFAKANGFSIRMGTQVRGLLSQYSR
jgi:hypothetical protein